MLAPMSRLVWVTGASSGIGAAVAAAYADTGATVLASARRDAPLRALAAAHPSVVPLPLDVTDQAAVDVAVADVLKRYGGVDVLVKKLPKRGQRIVTLADQFPSNVYAWRELAAREGGEVVAVERPSQDDWTGAVLEAIDERTAIAALPHNHWAD